MKIIPAIDLMEGKVVRLYKGDPEKKTIYSENPIDIAKKWEKEGADMIHLVDLDATLGLGSNMGIIKNLVNQVSIPVQVAGGLRDEHTISKVLSFASRIVLGTIAFKEKEILKKVLENYGKKRIVISVDHIDGKIMIEGWQKSTGKNLIESIKDFIKMGFSEFLLTNVAKDGTLEGPDLKFLHEACQIDNINVISSGGISNMDDVIKVKQNNAYGVILGKALYENLISIQEAKKYLDTN
ncbi:MAG TPA: 1-(5-phosphoribosyl)-5-[(5-phosphoribosylamino)methylideneamino]imidazole-4-carboxamide isomerase [Nitrosopumilaceae archaeon]|nr:1-(5-phosphoribosyl)-5-[(5-phosphoribosylamino)methylideneamino]imidazole-4-carboxamide isomerase [Nitrosopumilaceae archaeon]